MALQLYKRQRRPLAVKFAGVGMTGFFRLLGLTAWLAVFNTWAMDAPSVMVLVGAISPSALAPGVEASHGARVLMFSGRDGQLIGDGEVVDRGNYVLSAARLASFNKTPVVLELQVGRKRYALLAIQGGGSAFPFAGRTFPDRTRMDWKIGPQTAELSAQEAATPQAQRLSQAVDAPCDASRDINHDGRCDEADWAILRLYAGGITRSTPEAR